MLIQSKATEPTGAAHDRVYRALRTRILHGEIHPGQALTLRGIGKEFDVSMTPAREAARRLVAEGALSLSSSGRVSTPELTNERIEELAALRALLEPELAARALPRAHMALCIYGHRHLQCLRWPKPFGCSWAQRCPSYMGGCVEPKRRGPIN